MTVLDDIIFVTCQEGAELENDLFKCDTPELLINSSWHGD